jgi:hypothetical protein
MTREDFPIGRMPAGRRVLASVGLDSGRLSITGAIGHPNSLRAGNGDAYGQVQDLIRHGTESGDFQPAFGWTLDGVRELLTIWERWHLNDMRAGCEHQRVAGIRELGATCETCGYRYGSAWLREELPADVVAWAQEIIAGGSR